MPKNYYIILGIPQDSSQKDIKSAYRRLVKEYHPDHYGEKSSTFFIIQEAYSVLSDPNQRRIYDTAIMKNRQKRRQQRPAESFREPFGDTIEPLVPEKGPLRYSSHGSMLPARSLSFFESSLVFLFDRLHGGFEENMQSHGQHYDNAVITVAITPQQALQGGHVRFAVPVALRCPECLGRGDIGPYLCRRCSGAGVINREYPVVINHPPGIPDNHLVRISLAGLGIPERTANVVFRVL